MTATVARRDAVDEIERFLAHDRAEIAGLDDSQVAVVATFVGFAEDHLDELRVRVGEWLTVRRATVDQGAWTAFVVEFGERCGRSPRSLRDWMRRAQETLGLDAPKGANQSRRDQPAPRPAPIDTTARETKAPAKPAVKAPPAPQVTGQLSLFAEEAAHLTGAPVADLARLGRARLKALQARVNEALRVAT